ncbi:transposase [Pseudonocardia xishanensis]|uniref:Transposase n=1 Tax=Pseudonocardia xishanensis TaxID=630995 RepID=A0ABP8RVU8_9PSEU
MEIVPAPRKFSDEMRERAKRMVRQARQEEPGLSVNAACKRIGPQLGILPDTLRGWCRQADIDDGVAPGVTTTESEELKRLRRENAELRRANEILKTASAFFAAAELDRHTR